MSNVPSYVSVIFGITTFITVYLFGRAAGNSKATIPILLAWLILQAIVSMKGFYTVTDSMPPRFVLLIWPPLLLIILLFLIPGGRKYIDSLDSKILTYLHTIRIPVEIVLFWLFLYKQVPQLMTFEGRHFDILSGFSAPFVAYFGYSKKKLSRTILLAWNFICLGLLINIVIIAALSAPFSIQQFAFDQPDVAVLYFPFTWLPCCVVPIVLLSHLASIRELLIAKK